LAEEPLQNIRPQREGDEALPRSRVTAAIAVFAALAVALHLSPIKFPAPYAPFLIYELWEIPIVAAFLLYGFRAGVAVAVINFLSLEAFFRGELPVGPLYNLIAILSMMFGVFLAYRLAGFRLQSLVLVLALILGPSVRVVVMTVFNSLMLPLPFPLGFNIPTDTLVAILPLIALFNASVALYTIPVAYAVSAAVSSATRLPPRYGR